MAHRTDFAVKSHDTVYQTISGMPLRQCSFTLFQMMPSALVLLLLPLLMLVTMVQPLPRDRRCFAKRAPVLTIFPPLCPCCYRRCGRNCCYTGRYCWCDIITRNSTQVATPSHSSKAIHCFYPRPPHVMFNKFLRWICYGESANLCPGVIPYHLHPGGGEGVGMGW